MQQASSGVQLRYYGHCAFQWTTVQGVRVLVDPYRNREDRRWFVKEFPLMESDLVLITHAHFDHDAFHRVTGEPSILRGGGSFQRGDVSLHGVTDLHAPLPSGKPLRNTIFLVSAGGIRFCHLGDNRADLPEDVRQAIGKVDVLMAPVDDSRHLLSFDEVDELVGVLEPRVVVPTHYYIPGITTEESTLLPPEEWLRRQSAVRVLQSETVSFSPRMLPPRREVWVMRASVSDRPGD